jgi:glycosyltransferase involved in cell wall biosynthesis
LAADANSAERRAYHQMDGIFTIGEYLIEDLVQHYHIAKEKIRSVGTGPGGISPYTGTKDYTIPTILFVAKARFEDKGGDLLLQAFKLAKKSIPKLRLIIVGQDLNHFEKNDGLEIYGHVPFDQLKEFFAQSSLFAMPALNEPWGLVYLEAMLSKMPILGLRRNAIPEFTLEGELGFMAEQPTPESVAQTLVEAFSDTDRLRIMGDKAQENVRNRYTWANTVDSMLAHMQLAQS